MWHFDFFPIETYTEKNTFDQKDINIFGSNICFSEMTCVDSVLQQHWLLLKVDVVQADVYFCVLFLMNISIWPLRREADACWQRCCGGAAVVEWAEVMHQRDKQPEFMSVLAAAGPRGDERTGSTESQKPSTSVLWTENTNIVIYVLRARSATYSTCLVNLYTRTVPKCNKIKTLHVSLNHD